MVTVMLTDLPSCERICISYQEKQSEVAADALVRLKCGLVADIPIKKECKPCKPQADIRVLSGEPNVKLTGSGHGCSAYNSSKG